MLDQEILSLKSGSIGLQVRQRMQEFTDLGKKSKEEIFKELCFCLLTANYTAVGGIRIQKEVGDGFISLPPEQLADQLKKFSYRFPNTRTRYIVEARKHLDHLPVLLSITKNQQKLREWLVENVLGLGYKEASHFLRNIGYFDLAIIDFHIIDILVKNELIQKPKLKSLSRNQYLEIEAVLANLAKSTSLSQGELDLYLWYIETGKILK